SIVNDVHVSRSAFNEGDGTAAGPHPRRPVTAASGDYRHRQEIALAVLTHPAPPGPLPPPNHPATGGWPRCWLSSPTAAASSPQRPAWPSMTGWGGGVPSAPWIVPG